MRRVAKRTILDVKPYIPGKPIDEVKRELGLKDVIKLASNENPYGPSPKVFQAIKTAAKEIHRYPDGGCFYLRQALVRHLKVSPEQLIFGNGSDELIVLAIRAFVEEGDEVIIAKPSFLIYDIASQIAGAKIKSIPLIDFYYDLKAMKAAVTEKTKIIFLGNPDNPAGTYLTQAQVEDFLKDLRSDILIFLDEAYFEYVHAKDYVKSTGLINRYKNVFVSRTFSKMYGLAGLRVGYGIGSPEVVDLLNRIREPFNVNSLAQTAALTALADQSYYKKLARMVEVERKSLYKEFKRLKLSYIQSCTNFILIEVNDSTTVAQQLLKRGIIIRDMSHWGLTKYIRVTIGTQKENRRLIKALEEIL